MKVKKFNDFSSEQIKKFETDPDKNLVVHFTNDITDYYTL